MISLPPSSFILFHYVFTCFLVYLNSENTPQRRCSQEFPGRPCEVRWKWESASCREKMSFQCPCALYFCEHTVPLWALHIIFFWNIKLWPCFSGLMWVFVVAPLLSRPVLLSCPPAGYRAFELKRSLEKTHTSYCNSV